jgi:D-alanyl-D-alanine carboxypeptidase
MSRLGHFLTCLFIFLAVITEAQNVPFTEEHSLFAQELLRSFRQPKKIIPTDTIEPWLRWQTVGNFTFGKDRGSMTMIADLQALHPYFRDQITELIRICKSKGIELAIVESFRTSSKQNEYKSMGKKYTRSKGGRSKHQYGLAIDVVPIVDSAAQWHNKALWKKIGVVGEQLGLRWGGRWRHLYDPGHFEWTGGLTLEQLANGELPPIPRQEHYPCIEEDLKLLTNNWKAWENEQAAISNKETTGATKMK